MADACEPFPDLVLPEAALDRDAARRSSEGHLSALLAGEDTLVVEMHGDRAPVMAPTQGRPARLVVRRPTAQDATWYADGGLTLYVGRLGETPVVALLHPRDTDTTADTAASDAPGEFATLREVALALPGSDLAVFRTAVALFHWHERHPRCPRCGSPTRPRQAGWLRVCEADDSEHYPRTDPAVIMAVVDDADRLLLARGSRWNGPHRSVLAGFVEPGETFEQAVARETLEESGVSVEDVTYVGNQPWPFPASLMIGFMARARTHELTPQDGEIEEIAWYSRSDVAAGLAEGTLRLPGRLSIARTLIERWYGGPIAAEDFS